MGWWNREKNSGRIAKLDEAVMWQKIQKGVSDPVYSLYWAISKFNPDFLYQISSLRAHKKNLKQFGFILSFDCDTTKDIEVVVDVHNKLTRLGICPVYAVPGELLELGHREYRHIFESGAEFLNHGYKQHCELREDTGIYESSYFYDQLTHEQIHEDIKRGHETIISIFDKAPKGFRTPHFGSYQKDKDLEFLYKILIDFDYQFSSSTMPIKSFTSGPFYEIVKNFWEIPLTGCYDAPFAVFDSYTFRFDPVGKRKQGDYAAQFHAIVNSYINNNRPGLVNIYADPSQVYDWDEFFDCMKYVAKYSIDSYQNLITEVMNG